MKVAHACIPFKNVRANRWSTMLAINDDKARSAIRPDHADCAEPLMSATAGAKLPTAKIAIATPFR